MLLYLPGILLALLAFGVTAGLWPAVRSRKGFAAFVGTALVIHGAWFLITHVLHGASGPLVFLLRVLAGAWTVSCLACVLLGAPVLLARTVMRLARRLSRRPPAPEAPSPALSSQVDRRAFLQGAAVPAVAVLAGTGGTVNGMRGFVVRNETVLVPGLDRALDGFRIGQISDVHVGAYVDVGHLGRAIDALNDSGADLHVMTGDLIDDVVLVRDTFAHLERTRARHGMLAILGNHEKRRSTLRAVMGAYDEAASRDRLRLLVDRHVLLRHNEAPLQVVGVDYPMHVGGRHGLPASERNTLMQRSADAAFAGASSGLTTLCLSHHPDFFPIAAARGVALTLAGHTHGGQVAYDGRPIVSSYRYMLGRYRQGDSHLYVSGGTGHWLPFRVGVPAEVTVLTLRAA